MKMKEYFKKFSQKKIIPCGGCGRNVTNEKSLQCKCCGIWFHALCTGLSKSEFLEVNKKKSANKFNCNICKAKNTKFLNQKFKKSDATHVRKLSSSRALVNSSSKISEISAGAHSRVTDLIEEKNEGIIVPPTTLNRIAAGAHTVAVDTIIEKDAASVENQEIEIKELTKELNENFNDVENIRNVINNPSELAEPPLADVLSKLGEIVDEIKNLTSLYRIISNTLTALDEKVTRSNENNEIKS